MFRRLWPKKAKPPRAEPRPTILELILRQPILVLMLGSIVLLTAIVLHFVDHHSPHVTLPYVYTFLRELGFAFIIAYLLIMCIEKTSWDRHNAHVAGQLAIIQRDVFEAAYGRRQNPDLIKALEGEVFWRSFFRTHYEVEMVFRDMPSTIEPTMLKVDMLVSYKLHNMTAMKADTHFNASIEIPYDRRLADLAQLKALSIGGVPLTADEIQLSNKMMPDTPDFKRYRWPISVESEGELDVLAEYSMVKYVRDAMIWKVFDPCDGLRLSVVHPKDIVIFGSTIHSTEGIRRGGGKEDVTFSINIDAPLFPHNGVQIWWSRAEDVRNLQAGEPLKGVPDENSDTLNSR